MPAARPHRWSAREVRALIERNPLHSPRYEVVDGELLVTPSPNRTHQLAVQALELALVEYLSVERVGRVLVSPFDVEVEDENVTQPDLFVLPLDEFRRLKDPRAMPARSLLVAIEVASPSSALYDRVKKRPLYQRHVSEYWIVDADARAIERWQPGDERPQISSEQLTWHPAGAAAPFTLDLSLYFSKVHDE